MQYRFVTEKIRLSTGMYRFVDAREKEVRAGAGELRLCSIRLKITRGEEEHNQVIQLAGLPAGAGMDIVPVSAEYATGKFSARLSEIYESCREKSDIFGDVAGAVNGGFFVFIERLATAGKKFYPRYTRVGDPIGMMVTGGKVCALPLYGRAAMVSDGREWHVARPDMRDVTLVLGPFGGNVVELTPEAVNEDAPGKVCAFTPVWSEPVPLDEQAIYLALIGGSIAGASPGRGMPVPVNGTVLRVPPDKLHPATFEDIVSSGRAAWMVSEGCAGRIGGEILHAIEAGPVLVDDGREAEMTPEYLAEQGFLPQTPPAPAFNSLTNHYRMLAPRTALGVKENGDLLLAVFEGRQQGRSEGITIQEAALLMKDLLCTDAINLDGGASSELIINGKAVNVPQLGTGQEWIKRALALLNRFVSPGTLPGPNDLGAGSERTIGSAILITSRQD